MPATYILSFYLPWRLDSVMMLTAKFTLEELLANYLWGHQKESN